MAKTIKFNLICDSSSIRTLEELKNNFSVEDVLSYYDNKLLHRWLEVRGYEGELQKVKSISSTDTMGIIKELIEIFDIETDRAKIEEGVYVLDHKLQKIQLLEEYDKRAYKKQQILEDYHQGYRELIEDIVVNSDNKEKIKANIIEIEENYQELFEMDFRTVFQLFVEFSPMAVFIMLSRDKIRQKYMYLEETPGDYKNEYSQTIIGDKEVKEFGMMARYLAGKLAETLNSVQNTEGYSEDSFKVEEKKDKVLKKKIEDRKSMYEAIRSLTNHTKLKDILGENLKVFSGETDGYWKDIESKGKKYMIFKIENGNYIRNAGTNGEELKSTDINDKFVILDGIDYKSNNSAHQLLYMEV